MSSFQRTLLLGEVKGDLWNLRPGEMGMDPYSFPNKVIPQATSDDTRMIDEMTSADELRSGGLAREISNRSMMWAMALFC